MLEETSYTELAAWWGAILSSIVFVWNLYKWKVKDSRLIMWLEPNSRIFGDKSGDGKTWISVTISNIGDKPTGLQSLGMRYYASWSERLIDKPQIKAVFPNPSANFPLPRVLKPGDHWVGLIPQDYVLNDTSLEEISQSGHLIIYVLYSTRLKEVRRRLVIFPVAKMPLSPDQLQTD